MKRFAIFFFFFRFINISAQENYNSCFKINELNKVIQSNSEYIQSKIEPEEFSRQNIENSESSLTSSLPPVYTIPVVFHVLHNYGPENISDAQIIDCINALNEDFQKRNADTVNIVPAFQSIAADCQMEFRLASIDPNGSCTNGIERIVTTKTFLADNDSKINQWPNNKYLNIWTAQSLLNTGTAVYTQYPGGPDSTDGVMMLSHYVGRTGTSDPSRSRALTHEMGHYFKLYHPWGLSNLPIACGDDSVSDTPISAGWTTCNLSGSVCNPPIIENVQNFMENLICNCMFTQGQKARMHATLNSTVSGRNNLWTPSNLIATGTNGTPVTNCAPIADFKASTNYACTGFLVNFIDQSWNAPALSWSWTFPGGAPATSTSTNPSITYSIAGIYNATLVVTSAGGIDSITKIAIVQISDAAIKSMPFTEDFENAGSFPGVDGWLENRDTSIISAWSRDSSANTTPGGTFSIMMNNYTNTVDEIDSWVTPSIDFSNVGYPINISFKIANAQRNPSSDDQLKLLYSLNCGETWQFTSYNKSGAALSTSGINPNNFTPTLPSQWRTETVSINPVQNKPNVRFKFENTSDNGNNIFIDDINITGNITAIDKVNDLLNYFELYPNPTNEISTVNFGLNIRSHIVIEIKNILSKKVLSILNETLDSGLHEIELSVLSPGIYLVDVTVNNKHFIRKLIVT